MKEDSFSSFFLIIIDNITITSYCFRVCFFFFWFFFFFFFGFFLFLNFSFNFQLLPGEQRWQGRQMEILQTPILSNDIIVIIVSPEI